MNAVFYAARRVSHMDVANNLTGNRFDSAQVEKYDDVRRTAEIRKQMVPRAGIEPARV